MQRLISLGTVTTVAIFGLCAGASAHVTLQPTEVPAGAFKRLDVRVPNERDDATTKKVEVKFPPGFIFASYEAVPGWSAKVTFAKLDKPVEAFGEKHSEQVDKITFKAEGDGIKAGQFRDFGLSLGLPDKPGTTLTFKALQTYSSGEVVRWIGAPDADEPAPLVKLLAAATEASATGSGPAATRPAAAKEDGGDEGDSNTLSVIALIAGALGLIAGLAALAASRRTRGPAAA